jgi:glucokinase
MLNMYTLVGDIGNTDIKLCLLNKNFKIIKKIIFDKHHVKSKTYFKKKNQFVN